MIKKKNILIKIKLFFLKDNFKKKKNKKKKKKKKVLK